MKATNHSKVRLVLDDGCGAEGHEERDGEQGEDRPVGLGIVIGDVFAEVLADVVEGADQLAVDEGLRGRFHAEPFPQFGGFRFGFEVLVVDVDVVTFQ